MNNKLKIVLYSGILVLFITGSASLYNNLKGSAAAAPLEENGQSEAGDAADEKIKAPDFTVFDKDGNEVKLSDAEGAPVVLNFWASWCPPCKEEMPDFDIVYAELGHEVQFMMVDLVDGSRETVEKGAEYVSEQGFSFPVLYDTTGEAAGIYGIRSIPTTIFIDKDGYIVTGAQGAINEELIRKGIDMIK